MDMFDVFSGRKAKPKMPKAPQTKTSSRGGLIERIGIVVRMRNASVLFFDDNSQQEIFIPLSQVKDWWFSSSGTKRGLRLEDLELNDELTIVIPKWLALKEGMV